MHNIEDVFWIDRDIFTKSEVWTKFDNSPIRVNEIKSSGSFKLSPFHKSLLLWYLFR